MTNLEKKFSESVNKLGNALFDPEKKHFHSKLESFETYKARKKDELKKAFEENADLYKQAYMLIATNVVPSVHDKTERETLINELHTGQERLVKCIESNKLPTDKTLQEIMGYSTHTLELCYNQALHCFEAGEYKNGVALFSLLVMINPGYNHFWVGLGMCHQALTHWDQALKAYSMAHLTDPKDPLCHLYTSECHSQHSNWTVAREEVTQALELIDSSHDAKYNEIKKFALEWKQELAQKSA